MIPGVYKFFGREKVNQITANCIEEHPGQSSRGLLWPLGSAVLIAKPHERCEGLVCYRTDSRSSWG